MWEKSSFLPTLILIKKSSLLLSESISLAFENIILSLYSLGYVGLKDNTVKSVSLYILSFPPCLKWEVTFTVLLSAEDHNLKNQVH